MVTKDIFKCGNQSAHAHLSFTYIHRDKLSLKVGFNHLTDAGGLTNFVYFLLITI